MRRPRRHFAEAFDASDRGRNRSPVVHPCRVFSSAPFDGWGTFRGADCSRVRGRYSSDFARLRRRYRPRSSRKLEHADRGDAVGTVHPPHGFVPIGEFGTGIRGETTHPIVTDRFVTPVADALVGAVDAIRVGRVAFRTHRRRPGRRLEGHGRRRRPRNQRYRLWNRLPWNLRRRPWNRHRQRSRARVCVCVCVCVGTVDAVANRKLFEDDTGPSCETFCLGTSNGNMATKRTLGSHTSRVSLAPGAFRTHAPRPVLERVASIVTAAL